MSAIASLLPRELRTPSRRSFSVKETGKNKRKKPRITIEELNKRGIEAIDELRPDVLKDPDRRSTFEKVLDWIDLPRNVVGNVIGEMTGVDMSKLQKGAFGLPRVYMSDVLKKLGMEDSPVTAAVLGFAGDVLIDPLMYFTAGATTGLKISKAVPKVLKPGVQQLKDAARGIFHPALKAALGDDLVKAITVYVSRGQGAKVFHKRGGLVTKWLQKNIQRSDQVGDAAKAWFQQFGLKGRPGFRVPFTEVMGPVLPYGSSRRAMQAIQKMGPAGKAAMKAMENAQSLERLILSYKRMKDTLPGLKALGAEGATKLGVTERTMKGYARRINRQVKELLFRRKNLMASRGHYRNIPGWEDVAGSFDAKLRQVQIELKRVMGEEAPELWRIHMEEIIGPPKPKNWREVPRAIAHRLIGTSDLHQRELAIQYRMGMGMSGVMKREFRKFQPLVDEAAKSLAAQGMGGGDVNLTRQLIGRGLDIGGEYGVGRLYPHGRWRDAGLDIWGNEIRQWWNKPEMVKLRQTWDEMTDRLILEAKRQGIDIKRFDPSYFPRYLTKESQTAQMKQARRMGHVQAESFAMSKKQAHALGRTRLHPVFDANGNPVMEATGEVLETGKWQGGQVVPQKIPQQEPKMVLVSKNNYKAVTDDLKKNNWSIKDTEFYPVSATQMENLAAGGQLKGVLGPEYTGKTMFEMDPALAAARRAGKQERMLAAKELENLANQYGVRVTVEELSERMPYLQVPEHLPQGHDLRAWGIAHLWPGAKEDIATRGVIAYDPPVAEMMNRVADSFKRNQFDEVVHATDRTLGWFKRWALFSPAYVVRNMWQNAYGTLIAGGSPLQASQYWASPRVRRLVKAIENGNVDELNDTIMLRGQQVQTRELVRPLVDGNMVGVGQTGAQVEPAAFRAGGRMGERGGRAYRAIGGTADLVRNANSAVETQMRVGTFLHFLDQGYSQRQAMFKTLMAMPDLSDISLFERRYMTRLFPWWRWMRRNGALQLYYLAERPAWQASVGKAKHFLEGASALWRGTAGNVPEELRPEWQREAQAAQVLGGPAEGSTALLRSWFPYEEVQSGMALPFSVGETTRWGVSSMRPGIKFLAETATGQDIFRRRPVRPFSLAEAFTLAPKAIVGGSGTPLDNLLAMRPLREYGRRVWEQPSVASGIGRAVLGGAIQPISAQGGLRERAIQTTEELQKLRARIVRALENRDSVEANELLIQFMQIMRERQRLGLTIPKATQRAFRGAGLDRPNQYRELIPELYQ